MSLKSPYGEFSKLPELEMHKKVAHGERPLLDAIDGKPTRVPRDLRAALRDRLLLLELVVRELGDAADEVVDVADPERHDRR